MNKKTNGYNEMNQKIDLRVVKTQKNIQRSFIELLQDREFKSITVQNILDRAMINRTTFYKHYHDKYHLADTIIENLLERCQNALSHRFTAVSDDTYTLIQAFYAELYQFRDEILALRGVQTEQHNLWEDLRNIFKSSFEKHCDTFSDNRTSGISDNRDGGVSRNQASGIFSDNQVSSGVSHNRDAAELQLRSELYASTVMTTIKWLMENGDMEQNLNVLKKIMGQYGLSMERPKKKL